MKICDPLHAYIYLDEGEAQVVKHLAFQRLRSIHQLGFVEQAFPSGTHSRFSHSLGVCHLAGTAFDSIFSKNKKGLLKHSKKQQFRKAVRLAGLLHDIGHGPLSHSSESLMPSLKALNLKFLKSDASSRFARHEDYSAKWIMDKDQGFYSVIESAGIDPSVVVHLLHPHFVYKGDFFIERGVNFLPLLRQIVSSDFDVDRMDYLLRDSLYCGVNYGLLDKAWLISLLDLHIEKDQVFLAVKKSGIYTLESLILGRQHMRLIVYFHYKPAIYNQMLKRYAIQSQWRLPADLESYLKWTDTKLFEQLKSDDNIWAKRIIEQKPYKKLYESVSFESIKEQKSQDINQQKIQDLKFQLQKKGVSFIEINSEADSIKPHHKNISNYEIYLKGSSSTVPLKKAEDFLFIPSRRIHRIYIDPNTDFKFNL